MGVVEVAGTVEAAGGMGVVEAVEAAGTWWNGGC